MNPKTALRHTWQRYVVAIALIAAGAALRLWPLQILGSRLAWLTFYPAVAVAALYGGLSAGLLAAFLACVTVLFSWPVLVAQPFIRDSADWLGMGVFFATCVLISGIAEAMQRARTREQQTNEQLEQRVEKRAAELRVASERYRSTLDQMLEGCQILGFDWRYLYLNAAAENHNRRSNEELLGKKYTDMWPGIEATEVFGVIRRCMEERVAHQMENEFVFPDGTIGWFELSIQPVSEGVFILSQDISERKRAEAASRSSEEKFFTLFEKGVLAASLSRLPDGVMVNVNEAFERTFGYKRHEAVGKTSLELGINPDAEGRARILAALSEHGSVRNQELPLHIKSGEVRMFSVNVDLMDMGDQKYILNTTEDITDRKRVELETVHRLQNIEALRTIDAAIAGSLDLRLTLSIALEQVVSQLNVDAAAVLLLDPHTHTLEYGAGRGFRGKAIERSRLRVGEGPAGRVVLHRRVVSVHHLQTEIKDFVRADLLAGEDFECYHGTPLITKGEVKGVLEVFLRSHRTVDDEWLDFLETLAGQVAIAVDSASLFADLQHSNTELFIAYDSTIEGWSHALDLRDKETEGHTQRVTECTFKVARAAGMTEDELVHVRRGALLHDIGKMGVPDNILLKPDKLTDEEWVAMRKHPTFAFELLSPIAYLRPALDIPYCHHEKWDGSGYPRGLQGEQIPLAARLFAIVDVWDALRSDRPYRKAWPEQKVLEHIKAESGTHFDPKVVDLFLKVIREETQGGL